MRVTIRLTEHQRQQLKNHLFPGDGLEAAAVVSCGRRRLPDHEILTAQEIVFIPHYLCCRSPTRVTWPLDPALPLLHRAGDPGIPDRFDLVLLDVPDGGLDRASRVAYDSLRHSREDDGEAGLSGRRGGEPYLRLGLRGVASGDEIDVDEHRFRAAGAAREGYCG